MKNIITSLILTVCCFYLDINAQQVYFNRVFYTDTTSMLSVAVKPVADGYLVVGGFNAPNNYSATYLRKINLYGETEWLEILNGAVQNSAIFFGNSFVVSNDGNYFIGAERGTTDTLSDFVLMKLDQYGNVYWKKQYGTPTSVETGTQVLVQSDNTCLIVGGKQEYYNNNTTFGPSQFYIVKVDSIGNLLWDSSYGTNAVLLYAEQTQDGGYVLSGYRYSNSTGYDMYVVKTDSFGTMQWQRTYGTNENDGGCYVFQLADSNLILMGLIKSNIPDKNGFYIAKLNATNGAIVGQAKTHLKNNYYTPHMFNYSPETGIIRVVTTGFYPLPLWEVAITAISTDGDILWETPISSGLSPTEDYIRDIEPTSDGGYVLTGFNYASPASSWVLKTDSLGQSCGAAPCDSVVYTVSTSPPNTPTTSSVTLHPNPARGSTTIYYSLPPQLPFGVVELYDLQGQKVRYQVLPAGSSSLPLNPLKGTFTQTLDLSGLPSGMYVWRLSFPGGYERYEASGKIIVND
ncbi:MAG: T9SS type A sorting domain-containing protein [Sphingobacteriales bacterium]|nr:MAG: T9SS type A sorting domain-containing protein [Sphingobacteriales bacterium]